MKLTLLLIALACTGCYTERPNPNYSTIETGDDDLKLYEIQTPDNPPTYLLFDMRSRKKYFGVKHVGFIQVKTPTKP